MKSVSYGLLKSRGSHIYVGYQVDVTDSGKVLDTYQAGNHPDDSQIYTDDDTVRMTLSELITVAKTCAFEMAEEYGVAKNRVNRKDDDFYVFDI